MKRYAIAVIILAVLLALLGVACDQPPLYEPQAAGKVSSATVTVATTGNAGAALGSSTFGPIGPGWLDAVYFDFDASITTTTDITLSYYSPSWGDIITMTNSATDTLYYPRLAPHATTGIAFTDDAVVPWLVDGTLKLNVTQSTSATVAVTATVYWTRP